MIPPSVRRLTVGALALSYVHVVFGAIVRITGSGMGCGDHWPTCLGQWFPPLDRPDLIIEWTHRLSAVLVGLVILALVAVAFARRQAPGVGGRGGVLRPASIALALTVAAAVLGGIVVILVLPPILVVVHLVLAVAILAALAVAAVRAGAFGGRSAALGGGSVRTSRALAAAVGIALVVVVLGGLTANLTGAASACLGFPLCTMAFEGGQAHVQLTHRVLAYLLFFHVLGVAIAARRRGEPAVVRRGVWIAFGTIVLQVLVAAALVTAMLPAWLRSLHQAVGILAWVVLVVAWMLARRAAAPREGAELASVPAAPAGELRGSGRPAPVAPLARGAER